MLRRCKRWLAALLTTALLLLLLGYRSRQHQEAAGHGARVHEGRRRPPRTVPYPLPGRSQHGSLLDENRRLGRAHDFRRLVENACLKNAIVPLNPSCPRQLIVRYLESAGFGHQFTELLFGMYAAQYLGLTFTWSPIATSQDHGEDYTSLVRTLGLEQLFVKGLGLARSDDLRQLRQKNASLFGRWVEAENSDKRAFEDAMTCNNSVLAIEGWWHCHGVADSNCFWAPEHESLFQRYRGCLRAGVQAFGTAFDRCVFFAGEDNKEEPSFLPRDTIVVVWHLRFGDVHVRRPDDASFFGNVVEALVDITPKGKGFVKRVRIVLVGGGKEMNQVPSAYVESLEKELLRHGVLSGKGDENDADDGPQFTVERFGNSSFDEQFLAMMQADVLVGSGSSVPQVAAMLSSGRPLFFNHVPKHGYGYGQEATADSVDMDESGRVLESTRRVRLMLYERLVGGAGAPCRPNMHSRL